MIEKLCVLQLSAHARHSSPVLESRLAPQMILLKSERQKKYCRAAYLMASAGGDRTESMWNAYPQKEHLELSGCCRSPKKTSARVESRIEREGAAVQRASGHTLQAASNNARMHQRREQSQFSRL